MNLGGENMNKLIIMGSILAVLVISLVTQTQQVYASAGSDAGDRAARQDWRNGNGFHPGCADHGIDNTLYTGYCLSFKTSYIGTWALLAASQ
jgi:hypothetical protein